MGMFTLKHKFWYFQTNATEPKLHSYNMKVIHFHVSNYIRHLLFLHSTSMEDSTHLRWKHLQRECQEVTKNETLIFHFLNVMMNPSSGVMCSILCCNLMCLDRSQTLVRLWFVHQLLGSWWIYRSTLDCEFFYNYSTRRPNIANKF